MIYEIISLALLGAVIIYTSKVMYDVEKSYNSLLEAYKDANRKLEYMVKLKDGTLQPLEEYEAENPPTETRTMHITKKENK
ncbi:hypothetical protein [Aeromonas hydrophila]|uniref:Uncharacterized protein n=1 Tax=Aeromonas hydrophila TaxID=644 RepID=A0AAX3PA96_AERHY|nr:hypothetical protein [Aeromonas hydrophila]WEE28336.1 hypothetical protein PY771_08460 [Aeromonas hydrophila]